MTPDTEVVCRMVMHPAEIHTATSGLITYQTTECEEQMHIQSLLKEMEKAGFEILHVEEDQAVMRIPQSESTFILFQVGQWIQIAAVIIDHGAIQESGNEDALGRMVLRIHARCFGGRFGYDDDSHLVIQNDIYPENQNLSYIKNVISQLDYTAKVLFPLFEGVLATGIVPDDGQIDRAFEEHCGDPG